MPSPWFLVLRSLAVLVISGCLAAQDYYVSPAGDDGADGTTPTTAWATINRANQVAWQPGDRLRFAGGSTFVGNLTLNHATGTVDQPITIGSYGTGRATLQAPSGHGIQGGRGGGVVIEDLVIVGSGPANGSSGITWYADFADGRRLPPLTLRRLDISGFQLGLQIGAWHATTRPGWSQVTIDACRMHHNGQGMFTWGRDDLTGASYAHGRIDITGSEFDTNNGSGVVLSAFEEGLVERCTFHHNAANGGIWTYATKGVVIQHCLSYLNRKGSAPDGFGYDLDGGSRNCIIQYCVSYGNETAGYVIFNYKDSALTTGNIIRYNVSENDGRLNEDWASYMIDAWATGSDITDSHIIHNVAYLTTRGGSTTVSGLYAKKGGSNHVGCSFRNNIVYLAGSGNDLRLIKASTGTHLPSQVLWQGNVYHTTVAGTRRYQVGSTTHATLAAWRTATGQEMSGTTATGLEVDPGFTAVSTASSLTTIDALLAWTGYQPASGSAIEDRGLPLTAPPFALAVGTQDLGGQAIPQGARYEPGCREIVPATVVTSSVTYRNHLAEQGAAPADQVKVPGIPLTLATNTGSWARTGYRLSGWTTDPTGAGTTYVLGGVYRTEADLVLYPAWDLLTYPVRYTATGSTAGAPPTAMTKVYGVDLMLASTGGTLQRTGYDLVGWLAGDRTYALGAVVTANQALDLDPVWALRR